MNFATFGVIAYSAMSTLSRLVSYLPFSWSGLSAVVLGVLLAKWFWILFAPLAIYTSAVPVRQAGRETGQLFGMVTSTYVNTQGVALPNVQLLGVFTASAGKAGFAILKLDDNRQVGVAEGQEVAAGTLLIAVHSDHVMLEHGGVQQRVNLENKYPGSHGATLNKTSSPAYGAAPASKFDMQEVEKLIQSNKRKPL
jgi:hypothetical protein